MVAAFLFLIGVAAYLISGGTFLASKTVMHEIIAGIGALIGTVFVCSALIIDRLDKIKNSFVDTPVNGRGTRTESSTPSTAFSAMPPDEGPPASKGLIICTAIVAVVIVSVIIYANRR